LKQLNPSLPEPGWMDGCVLADCRRRRSGERLPLGSTHVVFGGASSWGTVSSRVEIGASRRAERRNAGRQHDSPLYRLPALVRVVDGPATGGCGQDRADPGVAEVTRELLD